MDDYLLDLVIERDNQFKRVAYCSGRSPHVARNLVQADLHNIAQWCRHNKLTINVKKTKSMIFGTKHLLKKYDKPKIFLNESVLENVNVMILPHLDYGDIVYQSATMDKLNELQRLQNRALRILTRYDTYHKSTTEIEQDLRVLPLSKRRYLHLLNSTCRQAYQPKYVDNRNLLTRAHNKKLPICPRPQTEQLKKSVMYNTATRWNNLTLEEQQATSYSAFKTKTKRREIENCWPLINSR